MNNNNITQLVRSVVSSLQNLPATSSQTSGSSSNNNSNTNRNIDHVSVNEEVSQRFRLPRGQNNSSARPYYLEEEMVALFPTLLLPRLVKLKEKQTLSLKMFVCFHRRVGKKFPEGNLNKN